MFVLSQFTSPLHPLFAINLFGMIQLGGAWSTLVRSPFFFSVSGASAYSHYFWCHFFVQALYFDTRILGVFFKSFSLFSYQDTKNRTFIKYMQDDTLLSASSSSVVGVARLLSENRTPNDQY
jgi:hypothetical protein